MADSKMTPELQALIAESVAAAVPAAVAAMIEGQSQAAVKAEEAAAMRAIKEGRERKRKAAGRPPRLTIIDADALKEATPKFRAGSMVRIRVHRGFRAFAYREDSDRSEPAEMCSLMPDEVVDMPINPDQIANQTGREMAASMLKGWFELVDAKAA